MRKTIALVVLATVLALAGMVSTGSAAAGSAKGTVHLSIQPNAVGYLITVSGTYTQFPSDVDVFVHAGTAPCAAGDMAETRRIESQVRNGESGTTALMHQELGTGLRTSGSFSLQSYWGVGARSGYYMICAYLLVPHAGSYGSPADPPQARASARLTMGAVSAPAPTTSARPFTLLAVRAQLSEKGNFDLSRPPLHTVRSGQTFWIVLYVRANRAMTLSHATWQVTEERLDKKGGPFTDTWIDPKRALHVRAGAEFSSSSSASFALTTNGSRYVESFNSVVKINGVTEKKSTWVRVVP